MPAKLAVWKRYTRTSLRAWLESEGTILGNLRDANTLKAIPTSIVKDFNEGTCTAFVGANNASRMTTDQIKVLPNGCLNDDARIGEMSRAQVQAIIPKTEDKKVLAKEFLKHENFTTQMTDTQLKAAAGNEFMGCKDLGPTTLSTINPATLAKLDYRCFNNVKWKKAGADEPEPSGALTSKHFRKLLIMSDPLPLKIFPKLLCLMVCTSP